MTAPRLAAGASALAGALFPLYQLLRPYSDESSLEGAAACGSVQWIAAHVLAMLGFALVALAVLGVRVALGTTPGAGMASWAVVVTWLGAGLTLPFFGAEAFALNVIGQEALRQQNPGVLALANEIRTGPGLAMFLIGLLLVAVGAIALAIAVWSSRGWPRWSGAPFALGFALFIPQFFGTQPIRVAHGLLIAVGCLWIAADLWRARTRRRAAA